MPVSSTAPNAAPQPNVHSRAHADHLPARFWGLAVAVGVAAGLAAAALKMLLRAVQHLAWSYQSGSFLAAVDHTSTLHRLVVATGAGVLVGLAGLVLGKRTGGGARAVTDALWLRSARLALVPTFGSAVLSVVIVAMGAPLGREGAPKEAAAGVASWVADWAGLDLRHRRLLIACAAGAGMAAIYNVPFGGAVFAVEVLLGTLALPELLPSLLTSLVATAVAWTVFPPATVYTLTTPGTLVPLVAWAAVCGPLVGVAAVLYVRLIAWAESVEPGGWRGVVAPIAAFAVLGAAAAVLPQLLGNGKDLVQAGFDGQIGVGMLAALIVLRPLATAWCLGSGAPGGLFTPTLAAGTVLGALLGQAGTRLWPDIPAAQYAMVGGGAFLAAAMQAPVASVVLMAELTGGVGGATVPLLLAVVTATWVVRRVRAPSIYEARLHELHARGSAEAPSGLEADSGNGAGQATGRPVASPQAKARGSATAAR